MKMLVKIAFRNLMRHKWRTILTGIVIAFGLWIFLFMDSVMNGLDRGSIDNMINLTTSAVKIHTAEFDADGESYPLKYGLQDIGKIEETLTAHDRVKATAPRTQFLGELSNYEESIPVIGTIVDPARDSTVFTLTEFLVGDYFSADNGNEIILGKDLARDLNVKPGDDITLYALTKYDSRNAADFKIIGLFNTTDPTLNKSGVYITFNAANDFLDLENTITELNVQLKRRINFKDLENDMKEVRALIDNTYPKLATYTFVELGAGVLELVKQKKAWGVGMTLVFLLIAAVGIVNSVLMSVYERVREVGVLRAMGLEGKEIVRMFMIEGTMIGFVGSLVGVLLGIATIAVLTTYGYPMDKIYGDMYVDTSGFPVWGTIYGEWNIPLIIGIFLFGILTAFLASIYPARRAAKMSVIQAIRFF
jgi:ABC-type lipoprotein release transport system permease subunit